MPRHPAHELNAARKQARTTRERAGIDPLGAVADLVKLVEEHAGVPVVVTPLVDAVDGAYLPAAAGATIFINARRPVVRQRFTLAHELGHHLLGHGRSVDDAAALEAGEGASMQERCATAFGAELLIPPDAARAWVATQPPAPMTLEGVVRFAATFGVSAAAARVRLRTAHLITDEAAQAIGACLVAQEHLPLYETLDLRAWDDTLARVALDGGSRTPAAFAGSVGALRL